MSSACRPTTTKAPRLAAAAIVVGVLLAAGAQAEPRARGLRYGPVPRWTEPLPVPSDGTGDGGESGIVFLLLDHQMNPAEEALFVHDARRLTNASGVQRGSQLSFAWDPAYETLTLHAVAVLREGRRIDALRREKVKVLQREEELDWSLYDGALTAVLDLEDVRPGDVVEYAYTLRGYNPLFGGRYLDGLGLRRSVPIARVRFRLLWPDGRTLFTKVHGRVQEPQVIQRGKATEWVWEESDVPALLADSDLPVWFDPYPWVQLSEYATWNDVARWAAPLYAAASPGDELRALAAKIAAAEETPRGRTAAALRFVQEEVRYLGLEMGVGSYRPNPPRVVLSRRFGDCKDKALLLVALLSELGVAARPALVATGTRQQLDAWHPSPAAFNHVIVRVDLDGGALWLDPTRTSQGGPLEEKWLPPIRRALVVDPATTGLSEVPDRPLRGPRTDVLETWTVPSLRGPASFVVTTKYGGPTADSARHRLATTRREVTEKECLEFYTERYPGITQAAPIAITDDLEGNVVTVTESYSVADLFHAEEGSAVLVASFYPQELRSVLPDPGSRKRTMPLGLEFPEHLVHGAVISLPDDWTVTPKKEQVVTSAFRFAEEASGSGRVVRFRYEWQTLTDAVSAADSADALARVTKIVNGLGWDLTHDPNARKPDPPKGLANLNVPVALATLLFLCLCVVGAVKAVAGAVPVLPPPPPGDAHLAGLEGWLLLVGFGVVVRPVAILVQIVRGAPPVFELSQWTSLTSPGGASYHPVWAPLLLGEHLVNVFLLVVSVVLLVCFFGKKRIFPQLSVALFALAVVIDVLDSAAGQLLPPATRPALSEAATTGVRTLFAACVWIPYMLRSRRVRATFVR